MANNYEDLDLERKIHQSSLKSLFMNMIVGLFIAVMVLVLSDILQKYNVNEESSVMTCYGNINDISLADKLVVLLLFFAIFATSFNFYIKVISFMKMTIINLAFSYFAFIPNIIAFSFVKYDNIVCKISLPNLYWLIPISIFFVLVKVLQSRIYLKNVSQKFKLENKFGEKIIMGKKYLKKVFISVFLFLLISLSIMAITTFVDESSIRIWFGSIGRWLLVGLSAILLWFYYKILMRGEFRAIDMQNLIIEVNKVIEIEELKQLSYNQENDQQLDSHNNEVV